jgi:uncharacterized membrane protein YgcG
VTSFEPENPSTAARDIPDTEVIVIPAPSPVFVDSTGRRRRVLRRFAYAFGGLCMLYGGLVSVSLAGGPVSSNAVLPLPALQDEDDQVQAEQGRITPTPAPTSTAAPRPVYVTEALPRRATPVAGAGGARSVATTPAPSRTPSAGPTRTFRPITPGTTRPAESTTKPTPSPTPPRTGTVTPPTTPTTDPDTDPPAPLPPAPPAPPPVPGGTGGGTGGGTSTGGSDDEGTGGTGGGTSTGTGGTSTGGGTPSGARDGDDATPTRPTTDPDPADTPAGAGDTP